MICGVDEAGRGPVIGPLVVCGVAVESDGPLRRLHVRDSKRLTAEQREALAPEIRRLCKVEVVVVSAQEIDAMREQMTLNEVEAKIFARVIEALRPDVAYVDSADVNEHAFRKAVLRGLPYEVDLVSKHGADDLFPVVSAASVMAKVHRDAAIRSIEGELGRKIGSGYSHDVATIAFLERWLTETGALPPHTRASWDTARRLLRVAAMRKLEEFPGGVR